MSAAVWSNVINVGLLMVAVLAAIVAIVQTRQAKTARNDAREANASAADHEAAALKAAQQSAAEASRMANALNEANELTRQQLPTAPWDLIDLGSSRYELNNNHHETRWAVTVQALEGGNTIDVDVPMPIAQVGPGDSLYFREDRRASRPRARVQVVWGYPDRPEQESWIRTLG